LKETKMDGQAESAPEQGGLIDLASFLDTPVKESEKKEDEDQTTDESTDNANPGEDDTEEAEPSEQEESDEPQGDEEEEPAPAAKVAFKVKGDDGTEETVELSQDELPAAFLRQKDYTKKTQALAERESQAVAFIKSKHDEFRNHYLSQAELARAAVVQMAGIRSESEMAQLASTDPASWVAEQQRQQTISAFINNLDQQINGEKQRALQEQSQAQQQSLQQQYQATWAELAKEKIDKQALAKIYDSVTKNYGYSAEELSSVYDHRLVKVLRDATAYQALKAQKPAVTKHIIDAPKIPSRQSNPAQERRDKALNDRFRNGRAKLDDLAQLLR